MAGPIAASTASPASTLSSSSSTFTSQQRITRGIKPVQSSNTSKLSSQPVGKTPLPTTRPAPLSSGPAKAPVALQPSALKKSATETQRQQSAPSTPTDVMTMSAVVSPAPTAEPPAIMSMTTKEWVIPPRPKPGRKPATDTPPTKRKAQNRAAQRAFRERRAARVGELEEQLDQQRDAQDQKENEYKNKIRDLEMELQSFRSRYSLLESMLEKERKERLQAETQLEGLRRQQAEEKPVFRTTSLPGPQYGSPYQGPHQAQATYTRQSFSYEVRERSGSNTLAPITQPLKAPGPAEQASENLTCGNCEPSGRCACVEEVLNAGCGNCGADSSCQCLEAVNSAIGTELKRSASPTVISPGHKRSRTSQDLSQDIKASGFSAPQARQSIEQQESLIIDEAASMEDCGFCKDGTYCVCADTAMNSPALSPIDTLPPITAQQVQQVQTPPPSDTDVIVHSQPHIMEMTADGAVKLPRRKPGNKPALQAKPAQAAKSGCGPSGPGSCAQCQRDPKSGLFCRLMAANFGKDGSSSAGCCGGKSGAGEGCCKTKGPPAPPSTPVIPADQSKITLPSLPSLGLSVAEAYQTLSSHRNFKRAEDDIGSWLPLLRAAPKQGEQGQRKQSGGGRMMPIEVEAASIMSVLKDFDVRFGREA